MALIAKLVNLNDRDFFVRKFKTFIQSMYQMCMPSVS